MRIGFLVWNTFQVAQSAEIAKQFVDPDFIFIDRDLSGLKDFNPSWLVPYGAHSRFVHELDLQGLDGQYDVIVAQFRPPLSQPWRKTRLVIQQYSLAKPKTAYNSRWFSADHGLVYGDYSEAIIGQMCPVSQVGNPRFDPVFEGRLDREVLDKIRGSLDPRKKTVVYQPTWGDLSTNTDYSASISELAEEFNVVVRRHHMTSIKGAAGPGIDGSIDVSTFPAVLDLGIYLNQVADIIVSDMSGAIFDALYCGKSVVLIGDDNKELSGHKKADPSAIEVSERHRIGPFVSDPAELTRVVADMLDKPGSYAGRNEALVEQCFRQRGGCAALAGDAIRELVEGDGAFGKSPVLRRYAAPDFNALLGARAFASARRRKSGRQGPGLGSAGAKTTRMKATSFVKNKSFFAAGSQLEAWAVAPRKDMVASIYQAFNANSALRFSPAAWKGALARLLEGSHSPETGLGKCVLRKMGMLKTVAAMHAAEGHPPSEDLSTSIEVLGPLADFFDLAARNEISPEGEQEFIGADGSIRPLVEAGQHEVAELYFALSVARELKDEGQRPYRSSQLKFAQNLFEELLKLGVGVYPRIQGGVAGVAPGCAQFDRVRFTWHTVDCGFPTNFHLKIGSLFGHFIVDEKGYSGWGSPAKLSLDSITGGIALDEADAHWRLLYTNLVEGSKSKYSQEVGDLPDFGDYIFFPMQVFDDTVARLADIDTRSLLKALVEWSRGSHLKVVVKRHPMCKSKAIADLLEISQQDGDIIISNANIHQLVAGALCVVTVNSGVGAEALLHLKPVVTTGGSDYAAATTRARSVEELTSILDARRWRSASEDEIKKFLLFYTKHYMVEFGDRESISRRLRELLLAAGMQLPDQPDTRQSVAIAPNDADIRMAAPWRTPREKRAAKRNREYWRDARKILAVLGARGTRHWLEGSTLSRYLDTGRLGPADSPIQVGVLVTNHRSLRSLLKKRAKSFGLVLDEKAIGGVPYAATIRRVSAKSPWKGPDLSLRYYYEVDGHAWSPQRLSLLANAASFSKAVYRASVSSIPASLREKVSFFATNPAMGASIMADAAGLSSAMRRTQKKRTATVAGRLLRAVFTEHLEIRIPMRFLDRAGHGSVKRKWIQLPANPHEYLSQRHGGRDAEAGDLQNGSAYAGDRFCTRTSRERLDASLARCKVAQEMVLGRGKRLRTS